MHLGDGAEHPCWRQAQRRRLRVQLPPLVDPGRRCHKGSTLPSCAAGWHLRLHRGVTRQAHALHSGCCVHSTCCAAVGRSAHRRIARLSVLRRPCGRRERRGSGCGRRGPGCSPLAGALLGCLARRRRRCCLPILCCLQQARPQLSSPCSCECNEFNRMQRKLASRHLIVSETVAEGAPKSPWHLHELQLCRCAVR